MKEKIKREIEKSKLLWTKKMKATNLWRAIGTKSNDPMQKLLMEYDNVQSSVEAVNTVLSNVFLSPDKTPHKVSDSNRSNTSKWKIDVFPVDGA